MRLNIYFIVLAIATSFPYPFFFCLHFLGFFSFVFRFLWVFFGGGVFVCLLLFCLFFAFAVFVYMHNLKFVLKWWPEAYCNFFFNAIDITWSNLCIAGKIWIFIKVPLWCIFSIELSVVLSIICLICDIDSSVCISVRYFGTEVGNYATNDLRMSGQGVWR